MPAFQHQVEGIAWLRERERALLGDEPGLGKSRQLLEVAKEPVLVVAPAMVLDSGTWDDEIEKWAAGMDVTQVAYSSLSERARTEKGGTKPTGRLRPELQRVWGSIIADEAHYLKNRKAKWGEAFKRLRVDSNGGVGQVHQATGTPIPNWAHEAFVLLQLLRPEDARPGRALGSYWNWMAEWFQHTPNRFNPWAYGGLLPGRTWDEFREANWQGRLLIRYRDECLDLPPLTRQEWRLPMGPKQKRAYRELKQDFIAWLDSGTEVVAWNSAAQLVKLCQAATGLEVLEPGAGGSAKLDALEALLADRPRPTLVVAHFRASVAAAARAAARAGKQVEVIDGGTSSSERRRIVRAFQAGTLQVLAATLDTISEGMTLVAADQIVFLERSWRPSRNEQAMRRLHRIGQERPVTVLDLVTKGTVDERVLRRLAQKTDAQVKALGRPELRELVE